MNSPLDRVAGTPDLPRDVCRACLLEPADPRLEQEGLLYCGKCTAPAGIFIEHAIQTEGVQTASRSSVQRLSLWLRPPALSQQRPMTIHGFLSIRKILKIRITIAVGGA